MKKMIKILAAAMTAISLSACSSEPESTPAATFAAAETSAAETETSSAEEDEISVGFLKIDGDKIYLRGNPTTGYDWSVFYGSDADQDIVTVSDPEMETDSSGMMGAASTYVYQVKGVKSGDAVIGFTYERSFEENSTVEKIEFKVHVGSDLSVSIDSIPDQPTSSTDVNKIYLSDNPTYGYEWKGSFLNSEDEKIIQLSGPEYESGTSGTDDEGGMQVFTVDALEQGSAELIFAYRMSTDDESSYAYEIYFTCTVNEDKSISCMRE